MLNESEIIEHFFTPEKLRHDVRVGVGDDSAILNIPERMELVVCTDTLVENVHFTNQLSPQAIGYKSLAVNLSDFAAIGGEPRWMSLALTLPITTSKTWLKSFSQGLLQLANDYHISLVGGDTTQGNICCISICLKGTIPSGKAILRSGAQIGDQIFVTGHLGAAGYSWQKLSKGMQANEIPAALLASLQKPQPRILIGQHLRDIATSAIDLSDGLAADLPKLLKKSGHHAHIELNALPIHPQLIEITDKQTALKLALTAGDDYELCFTAPAYQRGFIETLEIQMGTPITCIGKMMAGPPEITYFLDNEKVVQNWQGWQHFGV